MSRRKVHSLGAGGNRFSRIGHLTSCGRDWTKDTKLIFTTGSEPVTCLACLGGGASNSEKAVAAKQRNFKIKRLRGMYWSAGNLMEKREADQVRTLVDLTLMGLGAEMENDREARRQKEREADDHD